MRVLHITSVVNTTSTGKFVEAFSRFLLTKGHESTIAYGRKAINSSNKLIKIGGLNDVLLHGAHSYFFDRHGFGYAKSTTAFLKKIDEIKPDVICLYNLHGYYIHIELLFEKLQQLDIPVIWTQFDCWAFTGHCAYYDISGCDKWKTLCEKCPSSFEYPRSLILDQSKRNYVDKKLIFNSLKKLHIIVHSAWLVGEIKESFLNKLPVYHIFNGLDLSIFRVTGDKEKAPTIVLGVASIWNARKGLADLIQLATLLPEGFQMVIVGLSRKQKKYLPENIIGIERTEHISDLVNWYNKASVFVNPTYEDNFPTTNLEALACGTPVVTYDTGGSAEAIDDQTGIVIPVGKVDVMAKAVMSLSSQNPKKIQIACRERAEQFFNQENRFEDYYKLIKSIIE